MDSGAPFMHPRWFFALKNTFLTPSELRVQRIALCQRDGRGDFQHHVSCRGVLPEWHISYGRELLGKRYAFRGNLK